MNRMVLLSLFLILNTVRVEGKDLLLTNSSKIHNYEKDNVPLIRVDSGDGYKLLDLNGTTVYSVAREADEKLSDIGVTNCNLKDSWFCGNMNFGSEGAFKFVEGLPLIEDTSPIKISLLQYNMHLGGNLKIPLSVITADVTGSTDINTENALKLLDPEQGKLNIKWTIAGKYRIGQFCRYVNQPGACSIAASVGIRYLGIDKFDEQKNTTSESAFGAYAQISLGWLFPIYPTDDDFKHGNDAGNLGLKVSAVYYKQNIDDSSVLFSDAVDADGKGIVFEDSYGGVSAEMNFYIDNQISIIASYYKAFNNDQLGEQATVSISYSFDSD